LTKHSFLPALVAVELSRIDCKRLFCLSVETERFIIIIIIMTEAKESEETTGVKRPSPTSMEGMIWNGK
jgi:hypothetical protein